MVGVMGKPYLIRIFAIFVCCVCLLALSGAPAAAFINLRLSGLTCENDGSLRFLIETTAASSAEPANLSTVSLSATHVKLNTTVAVTGHFSKETITQSPKTKTDFQSDKGLLNDTGNYRVELTYAGCRYPPCIEEQVVYQCPGFVYDCARAAEQFAVTSCRAFPDKYIVTFAGLNRGQHDTRNPLTDILLFFESNARQISGTPYVAGKQLKDTGHDTYLLQFSRPAHETATALALGIRGCPEEMIKECTFDDAQEKETFFLSVNGSRAPSTVNVSPDNHTNASVSSASSSPSSPPESGSSASSSPLFVPLLIVCVTVLVVLIILLAFLYLKTE